MQLLLTSHVHMAAKLLSLMWFAAAASAAPEVKTMMPAAAQNVTVASADVAQPRAYGSAGAFLITIGFLMRRRLAG